MSTAFSVTDYLDQLEDLINAGRRVPLTPSVMVSEEDALELVDRLRRELPADLRMAQEVIEDREQVIEDGRRQAEELLARARSDGERLVAAAQTEVDRMQEAAERHAELLVSEHAVLKEASRRANEVLDGAEAEAAHTRREADAYARDVMERLADHLTRTMATVQKGLQTLPATSERPRRKH